MSVRDRVRAAAGKIAEKLHPDPEPPEVPVLGAEALPNGYPFDARGSTPIKEPDGREGEEITS